MNILFWSFLPSSFFHATSLMNHSIEMSSNCICSFPFHPISLTCYRTHHCTDVPCLIKQHIFDGLLSDLSLFLFQRMLRQMSLYQDDQSFWFTYNWWVSWQCEASRTNTRKLLSTSGQAGHPSACAQLFRVHWYPSCLVLFCFV